MKIAILGAAESGVGAAVLALKKGYDVFVSDMGQIKSDYKDTLDKYDIRYEEGRHSENEILTADEIIKRLDIPYPPISYREVGMIRPCIKLELMKKK